MPIDPKYLQVEPKEDSPSKLAAVAGKLTKFFLFATEFEKVRTFINKLRDDVDSGVGLEGPQGPQGPTGLTGATGDIGPQGPAGTPADVSSIELRAIARTGSVIAFDRPAIYNLPSAPTTAVLTSDLTGARIGVIQEIYSNRGSFTFPIGWVLLGSQTYTPNVLNIIYAKWVENARVHYWIVLG